MKRIAWLAVAPFAVFAAGCNSSQQAQNYNSSVAVPLAILFSACA